MSVVLRSGWSVPVVGCLAALGLACGRVGYASPLVEEDARVPPIAEAGPPFDANDGASIADADGAAGETSAPDAGGEAEAEAGPAGCMVTASAGGDYCAALPYLPEAPVIDGILDCGLPLVPVVPVGWSGGASPPDATAEYAIAWRPDGLYFFVQVTDPSHVPAEVPEPSWEGDAVELFMDSDGVYAAPPAYDNPGTRQFTIAAPSQAQSAIARAQVWYAGSPVDWTSTQYRAFATSTGYIVEAFVVGADLGLGVLTLAAGGHVGMDLSVDVSYPTDQGADAGGFGNRLGEYYLRVASADAGGGIPPFDARAFCVATLSAP